MANRQIKICLGSSCFSRGNNVNIDEIKKYLTEHEISAETSFSGRLCEQMCHRGPVITIDEKVYEDVNISRLHKILKEEFEGK